MAFFQVDGNFDIHYKIIGKGSINVLFIQGLQTTMGSWLKQMQYFASLPEYCCCYIDNRGVGLSGAPTGAYTTSGMARETLALVRHLQWTRYHLVGLSMGGMIALELALLDAPRLLSLTLMVTHAGGPASYVPLQGLAILSQFPFANFNDPTAYARWILPLLYSKKWREATYEEDEKSGEIDDADNAANDAPSARKETNGEVCYRELLELRQKNPQSFGGIFGQVAAVATHWVSYKSLKKLRSTGVPTLIMCASKDKLVRPENSRILRKVLRPIRYVEYEGSGHMIHREKFNEVNEELRSHFEACRHARVPQAKL